jgi:hypothetical protein
VCVAEKYGVERSVVLELVQQACGLDLTDVEFGENIPRAIEVLDRLRREGLAGTQGSVAGWQ